MINPTTPKKSNPKHVVCRWNLLPHEPDSCAKNIGCREPSPVNGFAVVARKGET